MTKPPILTPVFKRPAHFDQLDHGNEGDVEQHFSRVFHRYDEGRIVASFYGENHRADSEAYCKWCQERQNDDLE